MEKLSMNQRKKNVLIQLKTTITDEQDIESSVVNERGIFMSRDGLDVLMFVETTDDGHKIKNLLTIQPHKVSIKRSGAISMNQQFGIDQVSECMYEHPHGTLHMETMTSSISYQSLRTNDVGKLMIAYTLSLNGQARRNHQLTLTYQEEDMK